MNDLIRGYPDVVRDMEGRIFSASAHALERVDGRWEAWIEFRGLGRDVTLRTGRECEQEDRDAILRWAVSLQPLYLDGALLRATRARLTQFRTLIDGRAA